MKKIVNIIRYLNNRSLQENWKIATDHLRQYDLNRRRFVSAGRYCGVFQPPPLTSNYRQAILGG
jgi:hypothetical protein